MRENVCFDVSGADRKRLLAIAADRNTPVKVVWRTKIILATADGLGTMAIMRETGKSKPCVWRWQERFMHAGVDGLLVHGAAGAEATMGDEGQYGLAGKIGAGEELRIGAGSHAPDREAQKQRGLPRQIGRRLQRQKRVAVAPARGPGDHVLVILGPWIARADLDQLGIEAARQVARKHPRIVGSRQENDSDLTVAFGTRRAPGPARGRRERRALQKATAAEAGDVGLAHGFPVS